MKMRPIRTALLTLFLLLPCVALAQKPPINGVAGPSTQADFAKIIATTGTGPLVFGIAPTIAGPLTVGSGNLGTLQAPNPVLHEAQGGVLQFNANLNVTSDAISLQSADLSLATQATVSGTPMQNEQPGIRFTLAAVNYDSKYTVQSGDTNAIIAAGICAAIVANSSLRTALAATLDAYGQGMGNPFETGCSNQVVGAVMTFDQPYVGGTTVSALNSASTTITVVGLTAHGGTPRADGGPVIQAIRVYPTGYTLAANDLGPFINFQYAIAGGSSAQLSYVTNRFTASNSNEIAFGNLYSGTVVSRMGIGAGVYVIGGGSLGDQGPGTISAATLYAATTGANDADLVFNNSAGGNNDLILFQDAGTNKFQLLKDTSNNFALFDFANGVNALKITASTGNLSLGETGKTVTLVGAVSAASLPASAGAGGIYVCVDNVGALYKKASCP